MRLATESDELPRRPDASQTPGLVVTLGYDVVMLD